MLLISPHLTVNEKTQLSVLLILFEVEIVRKEIKEGQKRNWEEEVIKSQL